MKNIKLLSTLGAAALLVAATGAFASEGEALADNAWLTQVAISQTAPAPVAAAGDAKAIDLNTQAVTP